MNEWLALDPTTLRVAMARANIRSIARLARKAGISESYGRSISSGCIPSGAVRKRIAAVLRVEESALWRSLDGHEGTRS
jgi:hypothetical protein